MIAMSRATISKSKDFQHASSTNRKMASSPISIPIQKDKTDSSNMTQQRNIQRFQLATLIMYQRIMFHRIRSNQKLIPSSFQNPNNEDNYDYLIHSDCENNEHECDSDFDIFNLDVDDCKE